MSNRILIVEDDEGIASALALNMQFVGYDYALFDDGRKAAESLAGDHAYDLALLDIMLPGMDGFELFGYMERYAIPVIYMTAKTDSASEIRGLRDGAEDYIVKPFDMLTLMVRVEKVLRRTGRLNSVYRVQFLSEIWGYDFVGETRAIDMKIAGLRKKLDLADAIRSIPKRGYRLEER